MMLSPVAFSRLSPKEQATMLGIDTTEFDNRIAELKEEASFVRREIKNFGEIEIPEKVEGINIFDLIQERVKIVDFNQEQDRLNRMRTEANGKIDFWVDRVARLRAELMEAEDMVNEKKKEYNAIPEPQEMLPTMEIDQKISAASETNAKAIAYEQAVKKQEEKAIKENDLADNIERQKAEIEKKTAYMQGLDLPFVNLTIDDNGGLMMDGRPIQTPHFSTGELIKICTMLIMSQNKDESGLRYVYLENFDLLDDTKSKELLDWMMGEDLQVLCERVVSNQPEVLILQDIK